ncbi:hypothetical protein [Succinatimonas hippei]|uniref:hypothetical protein n=1 Tax=Succinatimonas hippei TaxID=626938 RepID=UPI0023F724A3|nr:hypothetical protein [Succinatimonas hippei]
MVNDILNNISIDIKNIGISKLNDGYPDAWPSGWKEIEHLDGADAVQFLHRLFVIDKTSREGIIKHSHDDVCNNHLDSVDFSIELKIGKSAIYRELSIIPDGYVFTAEKQMENEGIKTEDDFLSAYYELLVKGEDSNIFYDESLNEKELVELRSELKAIEDEYRQRYGERIADDERCFARTLENYLGFAGDDQLKDNEIYVQFKMPIFEQSVEVIKNNGATVCREHPELVKMEIGEYLDCNRFFENYTSREVFASLENYAAGKCADEFALEREERQKRIDFYKNELNGSEDYLDFVHPGKELTEQEAAVINLKKDLQNEFTGKEFQTSLYQGRVSVSWSDPSLNDGYSQRKMKGIISQYQDNVDDYTYRKKLHFDTQCEKAAFHELFGSLGGQEPELRYKDNEARVLLRPDLKSQEILWAKTRSIPRSEYQKSVKAWSVPESELRKACKIDPEILTVKMYRNLKDAVKGNEISAEDKKRMFTDIQKVEQVKHTVGC